MKIFAFLLALPFVVVGDSGTHDLAQINIAKRQAQASKRLNECPSRTQWAEAGHPFYNAPLFRTSFCNQHSRTKWEMICLTEPTPLFPYGANMWYSGECGMAEICVDGKIQNGMPMAWCMPDSAFRHGVVSLSIISVSNLNRMNESNATEADISNLNEPSNSSEPNIWTFDVTTPSSGQSAELTELVEVPMRLNNRAWFMCFVIGRSQRSLLKVERMGIMPFARPNRGGVAPIRCSSCSWLRWHNPIRPRGTILHSFQVYVKLSPNDRAATLKCLEGL